MPTAVVQIQDNYGVGPTVASAEDGIGFGLLDQADAGGTPVQKPTATGTNYSWYKTLHMQCTSGGGTTSGSNRQIRVASAPTTGLYLFFKDGGATYTQASGANKPTDNAVSNGAVPATYTAMTTTYQTWHSTSVAFTNATRNGNFVVVVFGVGNDYAGGAGPAIALPNIQVQYLET